MIEAMLRCEMAKQGRCKNKSCPNYGAWLWNKELKLEVCRCPTCNELLSQTSYQYRGEWFSAKVLKYGATKRLVVCREKDD